MVESVLLADGSNQHSASVQLVSARENHSSTAAWAPKTLLHTGGEESERDAKRVGDGTVGRKVRKDNNWKGEKIQSILITTKQRRSTCPAPSHKHRGTVATRFELLHYLANQSHWRDRSKESSAFYAIFVWICGPDEKYSLMTSLFSCLSSISRNRGCWLGAAEWHSIKCPKAATDAVGQPEASPRPSPCTAEWVLHSGQGASPALVWGETQGCT